MDGNSKELKYDPQCGMSQEEFKWRCHQQERLSQRTPELLHNIKILTQNIHSHFQDDPLGLKVWNEHERSILHGFEHSLPNGLASPSNLPTAVRYEILMKRKVRSNTFVGKFSRELEKLKQATNNKRLTIAASFVAGAGVFVAGHNLGKVQDASLQKAK